MEENIDTFMALQPDSRIHSKPVVIQILIHRLLFMMHVTGAVVGYNDDFCGLQSKATFVSNGNPVRVLIDRYFCASQSSCMTLRGTLVSGASSYNPCDDATALTCGSTGSFSLNGAGEWNNLGGPWSTPGEEAVYSFTATLTGTHTVSLTNSGYYVDIYYKSGSCGSTGWTYGDDIFTSGSISISMTAGTTYYLLVDDEDTSPSSGTITVSCPTPAADPCDDITSLTCAVASDFNLGTGNGAWNPSGPWGTPGQEQVFSYTPSYTGAYTISVNNDAGYVDLFIGTSCSSTGWTYLDDIFSSANIEENLTAGVTYYFLIDDENTSASNGTISVSCPCIPPAGGIDGSYTYDGDFVISGTTDGACNDCSLRTSQDRIYEVNISCAGNYTFTTCGGASWDTYLYLRTAACGGTSIALNDDACGLQSSVSADLAPGTYYIHVEGFSSFSFGDFDLSVSGTLDTPDIGNVVGPFIVCPGSQGVAYSVTGDFDSYEWTIPFGATIASGDNTGSITVDFGAFSGPISVSATNSCGSNSSAMYAYVPPAPELAISTTDVLCNGGSTGTISINTNQGTSPFAYTLDGQATVPEITGLVVGEYTIGVTDAYGCTADQSVTISEPSELSATSSASEILCNGGTADVTIHATGGTAPYSYSSGGSSSSLIISGVLDGPLSGGTPKAIEFYAISAIGDLSEYGFGSANNGGGSDGQEFTFPAISIPAGTYITVSSESDQFTAFIGTNTTFTSSAASINGDDAIELFQTGSVIDVFGDINIDGSGQAWDYTDGWAYRIDNSQTNGGTWDISEWDLSGSNALDGESSNATAATPFPIGTFTSSSASPSQESDVFAGLSAGEYSYVITDANGCETSTSITLTEPEVLEAEIIPGEILCNGGTTTITVNASGGTTPYTYGLGESQSSLMISGVIDGPLSGGTPKAIEFYVINDITDLSAYGFGSANNGGGSDGEEFTFPSISVASGSYITVSSELSQFSSFFGTSSDYASSAAGINGDDAIELFNNGSVVDVFGDINTDGSGQQWDYLDGWAYRNSGSTANGGTWDISQWTFSGANALDGESSNATASSPFPISSFTTSGGSGGSQSSPVFTEITAGSYNVIITDINGCVYSEIITIDEPTLLETSSTSGEILCFGGTTTATVSANGGTSPYTYTWNTTPNQVTATAFGLVAGTYSCTVMDNNACESTTTITISEPPLLVPSSTSGEILCFGGTTTVTISATGGTPPYSGLGDYVVTAGTYTYDVTDDNGCTYSTTITVDEPPLLVPSSTSGEILCFGGTTTVTVSATGGTPPYVGTGDYTVTVGTYTYDVTDANGCTYSTTITVDEPPLLVPSSTSGEILCFGGTTTVTVTAIGGTPPYIGTGDYVVTAGTYTYDVTDANGCTYSTTITVDEPPLLEVSLDGCGVVYLGAGVDYACATINTTVTGGVAGYTFDWTNTESTEGITVCPDSTSNYEVTVTDANGCTATADWQVQVVDIECSPGHSNSSHSGSGSHGSHSSHGSNSGSGTEADQEVEVDQVQ